MKNTLLVYVGMLSNCFRCFLCLWSYLNTLKTIATVKLDPRLLKQVGDLDTANFYVSTIQDHNLKAQIVNVYTLMPGVRIATSNLVADCALAF